MGWETRQGRGRYYTRSERLHGRVVRTYIGAGREGEAAAAADALRRRRAALSREESRRLQEAEVALSQLCEQGEMLARAVLLAAGYHQHHRGEWRKRRGRGAVMEHNEGEKSISEEELRGEEFGVVLKRADAGNVPALQEVRRRLQEDTSLVLYCEKSEQVARRNLVGALMHRVPGSAELLLKQAEMAAEILTEPNASPIERMLIGRLVTCWLWAAQIDAAAGSSLSQRLPEDHLRRAQDSATRRFLSAAKTLAQVQRLAVPVLQVNIGENQVNVAGRVTTGAALAPAGSTRELS